MSFYPPPTEILPIFNPADYDTAGNTGTEDIPFLSDYFLRFPVSQGSETIAGTLVSEGQITAETNLVMTGTALTNYIEFPDGTRQFTAGGGGGGDDLEAVLTAGNSAGSNTINMNGNDISNIGTITQLSSSGIDQSIFLYKDVGSYTLAIGTGQPTVPPSFACICIGEGTGAGILPGGDANIIIGTSAGTGVSTGASNILMGYQCAQGITTQSGNIIMGQDGGNGPIGDNNVIIGNNGVFGGPTPIDNSVGLGNGVVVNASDTVVLGTTSQTVFIPNTMTFSDGSQQRSSAYSPLFLDTSSSTYDLPLTVNVLNITSSNTTTNVVNIPPLDGDINLSIIPELTIYNLTPRNITLSVSSENDILFFGKYGNGTTTLILPPASSVVLNAQPDLNYNVVSKTPSIYNISFSGTNTAYSQDLSILESNLFLTATVASSIFTIPSPVDNALRQLTITNTGSFTFTVEATGGSTFLGRYGTGLTTLKVPENIVMYLYSDGTNWEVFDRTGVYLEAFAIILPTYDYSTNFSICEGTLRFAPSSNQTATITLPAPSNVNCENVRITVGNSSFFPQILSLPSGIFSLKYGTSASTFTLPGNSDFTILSNGVNWQVLDTGSQPLNIPLTLSASVNLSSGGIYANCNLFITATNPSIVITYPTPNGAFGSNGIVRIENVASSVAPISLSIATGLFSGAYGSGTTTYTIPVNTFIDMTSNGTNWLVNNRTLNTPIDLVVGGILNWTNNLSFLDTDITIPPADAPINSANVLAGTAVFNSNTLQVTAITSGRLTVGSVVYLQSSPPQRITIVSQFTSTAGGGEAGLTGTYGTGGGVNSASSFSFTGFFNTNQSLAGTITATALQTTYPPVATITPTIGLPNILTGGSVLTTSPIPISNTITCYTLDDPNSGGTGVYQISKQTPVTITGAPFYATQGNQIQLPPPASAKGKQIKFYNANMLPCYITTNAGSAVFGGKWGQQIVVGTTTTYSTNYLLRSGKSVVLQSDGVYWNAIDATQGNAIFSISSTAVTSTADNTPATVGNLILFDFNDCNLTGLTFNTSRNTFFNNTGVTINILVGLNCFWANPTGGSPIGNYPNIPTRSYTLTKIGNYNGVSNAPVPYPCPNVTATHGGGGGAGPVTFIQAAGTFIQSVPPQLFVLAPGDGFTVGLSKQTGVTATEQTLSTVAVQIIINRIG